ncbi:S8 family serine peptidase [Streptomyces sp. ADI93-02]|uniref:S8 family serine peptidase n=1 Tax=Streptomyces sp. ADI93-02 TaxID=1522757 RepID=UPI001F154C61|nr:S8 family serine peptidase [Streptomyces sp. ADI93-02]
MYPDSALAFIASGVLDRRLFNVTELLADGYDDAHSDSLPLIVTYTDEAARSRGGMRTPEGAERTLSLSSIQGAAIAVDHDGAAGLWSSLTDAATAPAGRAVSGRAMFGGGIAKVWLDGKVKATLSDTTTQIGAPAVWAGGNTGQDVDVAVLDTGIDAAHPDFVGRIEAAKSFVPGQDATDRHGHGTHVASTVAGTGAASGGLEKGVAPGAGLHIGKVLDDDGNGQDSWILAGMEWAARDQHAKVVSMSLGGGPTDGTDPLSQAVNSLSEETGSLFVVAAGNSGPEAYSVGAPGAADAALTVGAVRGPGKGVDSLADFSSRGPRVGDNAIKPDLTAPGVNVLAARSQFAAEGEGFYQSMSGTSMATPHVAGAAALLGATHRDWTGQQLKDALVSTTVSTEQFSPFQSGSGRLDIGTAAEATLFASGPAFVQARPPYSPGQTVRKDVTFTNTGAEPVVLDLSLAQAPVTEGMFTLSDSRITVPARGTTTVGVNTHLDVAKDNSAYSARLIATGTDGTVRSRTSVGVNKEGQRHTLTLSAKDRSGAGLHGTLVLKDVERDTAPEMYEIDASGSLTLRLPPSTYSAWMNTSLRGIGGTHSLGFGMFSAPQIDLSADRSVRFDAADLRKAAVVTPHTTATQFMRVDQYRENSGLFPFMDSYMPEYWRYDSLWVTPTQKVTKGSYTFATRWRQIQEPLTFSAGSHLYDDVVIQSLSPALPDGKGDYRALWAGDGSAADFRGLRVRGQVAVVRRNDSVSAPDQAAAAAKAGARQLLILNDGYGKLDPWAELPEGAPLPTASLGTDDSAQLLSGISKTGSMKLRVVSHPRPRYLYDLVRRHDGAVPQDPSYRPTSAELARIDETFRDTEQGVAQHYRTDVSAVFDGPMLSSTTPVATQGKLTSWVTAGTGARWITSVGMADLAQRGLARTYKPRGVTGESWFSPIQRPRLLNDGISWQAPYRTGNIISTSVLPVWGDAGGHAGVIWADTDTSKVSLYQGDTLLGEDVNERIITVEGVEPGRRPYRMVVEGTRNLPHRPYSTRTLTEWGFVSSTTDHAVLTPLALVQLDYSVATDLSGKAHRRAGLTVTPSHLEGAAGAGAVHTKTLEVSYDDGATWRRASLRRSGDGWTAQLDAPRRAAFTSLRTTAEDTKGNSISQTVIRAFGLR